MLYLLVSVRLLILWFLIMGFYLLFLPGYFLNSLLRLTIVFLYIVVQYSYNIHLHMSSVTIYMSSVHYLLIRSFTQF